MSASGPQSQTSPAGAGVLTAPYTLEYTYRRSTGPLIGRFLAGLQEGRILGVRTRGGEVLVPPPEYAPGTGEALGELVEVASTGVVTTWAWVCEPRSRDPLSHPFAWALVRLDGASSAMLHVVDAGQAERMSTGMRVRVRWREARDGSIRDIACFEPCEATP
ncbi:Zn-ribbon domain-containing OB-fold protein [Myxococcus landrumensis]|uniref:OB-fold domain-containing protein n=1 Tax=Myxococcus landrumensis TaxID=2813577 RepID=A0ABX7N8C0_9BACT|nr:OB-fold domain-containing protein [Myxococcus landrumus]QSQ14997.1 OB-fold domain-containing protein [Myxococcus landrumus]